MPSFDSNLLTKKQLLSWVNQTLQIHAHSIEQLGNGAAFCQLLDVLKPGCIKMAKLNWNARLEHQCLANLKMLSTSMLALGIDKKFDVTRIAQKKQQEILQLLQWFRRYFMTARFDNKNYDPVSRRKSVSLQKNPIDSTLRQSGVIIKKPNVLNLSGPSISSKKKPHELPQESELKNRYYAIKRIVQEKDVPNSPETKLEQIKKILLNSNNSNNSNRTERSSSIPQLQTQNMASQSQNLRTVPDNETVKTQENPVKIEENYRGHQEIINTIMALHAMNSQCGSTVANPYMVENKSQAQFAYESDKKTRRSDTNLYQH